MKLEKVFRCILWPLLFGINTGLALGQLLLRQNIPMAIFSGIFALFCIANWIWTWVQFYKDEKK